MKKPLLPPEEERGEVHERMAKGKTEGQPQR